MRDWRVIALIVAVVAALGGGFLVARATQPAAAPTAAAPGASGAALVVEPLLIDFGPVAYDQRVAPAWTLKNVGQGAVQIRDFKLDVVAGC